MMLVPRRNNFDLFDDFFDDDFFRGKEKNLMRTDIRTNDNEYILDIDLPGFDKDNIDLSLRNGNLIIKAKCETNNDANEDKYIRKERFYGECSRSFYVGEDIKEEDIKAEFKNGILKIRIPKIEENKELNEPKKINID